MKDSVLVQLFRLFYLPVLTPMCAFFLAMVLGVSGTLAIVGALVVMAMGAVLLSYLRLDKDTGRTVRHIAGAVLLSLGAAFAATLGYYASVMSGSIFLLLLCVLMYSLCVALSATMPAMMADKAQPEASAPQKRAPVFVPERGHPGVIVTYKRPGMAPQIRRRPTPGSTVPMPTPEKAPKNEASDSGS